MRWLFYISVLVLNLTCFKMPFTSKFFGYAFFVRLSRLSRAIPQAVCIMYVFPLQMMFWILGFLSKY